MSGLEAEFGLTLCDKVQILLHHHGYNVDQKNRAESMIHILSELLELDSQVVFEEEEEEDNQIENEEEEEKIKYKIEFNQQTKKASNAKQS